MAGGTPGEAVRRLRRVVCPRGGTTDAELVEGFLARRDEACFEALVRRHGPMVFGVCRRLTGDHHLAEDAFQAVFLLLARKAAAIAPAGHVGNWLYGVAYRTALRARRVAARRLARERPVGELPQPPVEPSEGTELGVLVAREVDRLPDRYRVVVVLCDLEGQTRGEAARQLGLPEGTVSGRLTTARRMLAVRLARCGYAVPVGVLLAAASPGAAAPPVPARLIDSAVEGGAGVAAGRIPETISAEAAALTEGVLRTMVYTKLRNLTAAVLAAAALGGAGAFAYQARAGGDPTPDEGVPAPAAQKSDKDKLQGKWEPVSGEVNGTKLEGPKLEAWVLTFDGDTVVTPIKDGEALKFTLDPAKKPKEMDLVVDEDVTLKAIYEFDGDKLKFSFVKVGDRPADFDTAKNASALIVLVKKT
jgi:RNA polymerase sigma factor (sigma-70 family)